MHKIYPLSFVPISLPENGKTTRVATDARERVLRPRARESARDAIFFVFFSRARPADLPLLLLLRIFALSPFGRRRRKNQSFSSHTQKDTSKERYNERKKKKTKEKDHQNKHEHHHHRRKAKERTFSTVGFFNAFAGFALARFVCAEFVRVVWATTFAEEAATAYMIFFFLSRFFFVMMMNE